ncbi:MAG TPA: PG0541 family transporter-associated protein [Nitrospira sp.]
MMKMMVFIFRESLTEDIHEFLKNQNVSAFSEILSVQGTGESGRALGTLNWPGHNSLILTAVPADEANRIAANFTDQRNALQTAQHGANIPMKMFVLPIEQAI